MNKNNKSKTKFYYLNVDNYILICIVCKTFSLEITIWSVFK